MKSLRRLCEIRRTLERAAESDLLRARSDLQTALLRLAGVREQALIQGGKVLQGLIDGEAGEVQWGQLSQAAARSMRPGAVADVGHKEAICHAAAAEFLAKRLDRRAVEAYLKTGDADRQLSAEKSEQKALDAAYSTRRFARSRRVD